MDALLAADNFIFTTVTAWGALTPLLPGGVYEESAVPGTVTRDHLVYSLQSHASQHAIGNVPYGNRLVYMVKAILPMAPGNPYARGGAIMGEVFKALIARVGVQIAAEGPYIHGAIPRGYVRYGDPPEAPKFLHYGRMFEIQTGPEPV